MIARSRKMVMTLATLQRGMHARAVTYGAVWAGITALLIGLPTDLISNPWFDRMMVAQTHDYVFLALTALMAGLLGATYAFPAACPRYGGRFAAGGILSFLAVGCPICNQLVVLALGTTGAMAWFAPLQPLLAIAAIGLMAAALFLRVRALRPPAPVVDRFAEVEK